MVRLYLKELLFICNLQNDNKVIFINKTHTYSKMAYTINVTAIVSIILVVKAKGSRNLPKSIVDGSHSLDLLIISQFYVL